MVQHNIKTFVTAACHRAARTLNVTALLSLGLAVTGAQIAPAHALTDFEAIKIAAVDAVPLPRPSGPRLSNGVYLYGESVEREQLGQAYMVFQVEGDHVTGAVYWPQSSFNCFDGRFNQQQLALRVTETYSEEVYTHAIALAPETSIVASNDLTATPVEMGLEGMHAIEDVTENDERMLAACQADG